MPARTLKKFLDENGAKYVSIEHSPAFTAPEIAASADVSGNNFAKTVIVKMDGDLAMVVLPANRKIVISELREMMLSEKVELATESEFQARFPDCEVGAMPPFGNLYGLPVYLAQSFSDEEEIAFNAGTHREVIKMPFEEYANLVNPTIMDFVTT
jgi:Ala-tRNA(Pro) deacylase